MLIGLIVVNTGVMYGVCFLQYVEDNLSVMSIGFLLSSPDDAIIWRGPKKNGIFPSFLYERWPETSGLAMSLHNHSQYRVNVVGNGSL